MIRCLFSLLMLFACTTQGCISDKEPEGPSLTVGDSLPDFSVEMNTGELVSTSSLRGLVSVIVFFNTGCPDCQKEFPVIQQLWDYYEENEDIRIVAISREESAQDIQAYWDSHNLTFPYSAQETRDVYSLFAPSVIPRIYISNQECVIQAQYDDTDLPSFEILKNTIEKLIP